MSVCDFSSRSAERLAERAAVVFRGPGTSYAEHHDRGRELPDDDVVFLDELPNEPAGKILEQELRDAAGAWNRERARTESSAP